MKTLSFRNLKVGRAPGRILLELPGGTGSPELKPGLHLLVAPNGYGKTTFLQTIAGVLPRLGGDVLLEGSVIDQERDVLYVSEYLTFPKFIYPAEWIQFMSGEENSSDLSRWIDGFALRAKMSSFLGRMSQGERRKVTWLGAQASRKSVLLLDEPLDGLDLLAIDTARAMVETWKREGRIVIVVAHQVGELLDLADQVILIHSRRLIRWSEIHPEEVTAISPVEFRARLLSYYSNRDRPN